MASKDKLTSRMLETELMILRRLFEREIADMQARLHGCAGLHVLPLHAQLSAAEQRLAFQGPPRGTTKVRFLATHTHIAPEPEPKPPEPEP